MGLERYSGSFFLSLAFFTGCFLEVLESVPSGIVSWTQLYFLVSRFQLQHRNRNCIWRRWQPWVQQKNLFLHHSSVTVWPLEPTWGLLMSQGHTASPVGILVRSSPALASHLSSLFWNHFSFISTSPPYWNPLPCPLSSFHRDFFCSFCLFFNH